MKEAREGRDVEIIFCNGNGKQMGAIAIAHGMLYGAQLPCHVYYDLYFADQDWKRPDRDKYVAAVQALRPSIATVIDVERPGDLATAIEWGQQIAPHVKEIIIIPKVPGIISDIPHEIDGKPVRLGYSVPTRYGGTPVPTWEFSDRPVHLLGGSPAAQWTASKYLNVKSLDSNYVGATAIRYGVYFAGIMYRSWPTIRKMYGDIAKGMPYLALRASIMNVLALWAGASGTYRPATASDVAQIARRGGPRYQPMQPDLVICADRQDNVIGYARREPDGTIAEIWAGRDEYNIIRGLQAAQRYPVPAPAIA